MTYKNQHWRQPYHADETGSEFVNNSAWFPKADTKGPLVSQLRTLKSSLKGQQSAIKPS